MPEGGALASTQLMLALTEVDEIEDGLWAYDALRHRLIEVCASSGAFIEEAARASAGSCDRAKGVGLIWLDAKRMGAKYETMTLSASMLNAGVMIAAAYIAGAREGIGVRALGTAMGSTWLEATNADPTIQVPLGSFAFGPGDQSIRSS